MSESTVGILLVTALSIGFFHTLIGVDHYLPFIVLGRARRWTMTKALMITALCGVGHVVGSIVLGFVGIGIGAGLNKLEWIEASRGDIAAWALIVFGLGYALWAFLRARRGHGHSHFHRHPDGTGHDHDHDHDHDHAHFHEVASRTTFWSLFLIFAFGPCEPLIPLLMAPAFEHHWAVVALVALTFAAATIATMLVAVAIGIWGLRLAPLGVLEKYAGTFAGLAIASSGLAIRLLGI